MSSTDPTDGATGVPVNTMIAATFSEAMDPATITEATFTLMRGTTPVTGTVAYDGVTATFSPTSNLVPNTLYTARLTTGAEALAKMAKGNGDVAHGVLFAALLANVLIGGPSDRSGSDALAEDFVWTFTTGTAPDSTAPMVTSTVPANGSIGVSLGGNLAATFSESMDPLTINTSTFTLRHGTTPVAGTVDYAGVTAIFNPTSNLAPSTLYTARITTGAEDLAGNALASDYVWTFTTGAVVDTTAPMVSFTVPTNGQTGVLLGRSLSAGFSEAMNPLTINTSTFALSQGVTPVSGTVSYVGHTAIFNPTNDLAPNTLYTATITAGVEDLAGNSLAVSYVWTFTTGTTPDTTPPMISSTDPVGEAAGVPVNKKVTATFSEAMNPLTITADTFTLMQGTTPVIGTVSYVGFTATFIPADDLEPDTTYTATVWIEATDLAGNALTEDYVWTFITGATPDATAPMVNFTIPANGSIGASLGWNVVAAFTEAMDPLSITTATFTLTQGTTPVLGTVTCVGVNAAFNPASALAPDTEYTATITTDAADLAGNALAEEYVWTFTTGATPDVTAPMVNFTVPTNGSVGTLLGWNVVAAFTEAMDPLSITTATFTLTQGTTPVLGTVTCVGVNAAFNPASALASDTLYTARITSGAADLAGNTLAEDYVWTFTTGATPDVTAPMVNFTVPTNGSIGTLLGWNVVAAFTEAMDPLSITTATFTLRQGTTPILGTVTCVGVNATFNPASALASDTLYTARITSGAADLAGNTLAEDYVWTFTTGATPDVTAPMVNFTVPTNGSVGTLLGWNVVAAFTEAMDPLSLTTATFTLRQGTTPILGTVTCVGVNAAFNPASALAPDTLYTARITSGAADLAGNALAEDYVWTFTTGAIPDTTAPMVSLTVPASGSVGTWLGWNVVAAFTEAMDPLSLTTATFTLRQGTTPILGTVTCVGVNAAFNPASALAPDTLYTARITSGATDLAGNALAEDYVWTFTTGATADATAPMVSLTIPANGSVGASLDWNVVAAFTEAMDPLSITTATFSLRQGTTPVLGTVTCVGVNAAFNPASALAPDTLYTARITSGAADLAGNTLAEDYVWTFTTGATPDTTAPMVSLTDPVDEAVGVPVNKKIAVAFTEAMDPLTINTETFTLRLGTTPVIGTVTYVGVTATFTPVSDLLLNETYTATVWMEAADLAGNAMVADFVWTFTTGEDPDITAPMVSFVDPGNFSIGVPLNKNIAATFTEAMDPLTINTATFTLRQASTPVLGLVTYVGVTATFNPVANLAANTVYTATITTGAEDLAWNALASNYVWTFTTGAAPDITLPMVSLVDPASFSIGVPLNKKMAATFTEVMDPLTVTTATFTLREGTTPIIGTVTYVGVTATFTPVEDLEPNTTYTATIWMEATDLAGNGMAEDFVWTFTTGAAPDITAPMISSTDPMDEEADVPVNKTIAAIFTEAMSPLTISTATFTLVDDAMAPVIGLVSYAGVTAAFNPVGDLEPSTTYTATIWMEATDLAGNGMAVDFVWTFTTSEIPDTTVPMVSSTDPVHEAIGVPVNTQIAATFSEAMDPLTINTATFTLRQGTTPVIGTVSYVGVTATFIPVADLESNTTYTATVWMEAADLAGNTLSEDFVWTFTTGATPDVLWPTVISTDPVDEAIGVPINKNVSVTFSEAMDPLTISTATFTLDDGVTTLLGMVTYADMTATFNPSVNFVPDTIYTATILMEAADLAGNPLVADYVWTFTAGNTTTQGSIDLGSANAFAILAGSTCSNTGPSIVTGNLGVSPGTAVVGFPPGILDGALFTGVASAAGQAKLDLTAAFNEAAGRSVGPVSLPGDLSGLTLYPGLYTNSTSVMLSAGNVTLDAQGDAKAVFLFQMGSTLTTGSGTQVVLAGGAKAANVYWQVGTSATLGTTSIFKGNILAQESITLTDGGANLEGRALTQTAAVTLGSAIITVPTP